MTDPDRWSALVRVEPPPELDRCVRERLLAAVRASSADGADDAHTARAPSDAAVPLPLAERCVYALGLIGYGAHALGTVARLVWRAVVG